MGLKKTGRLLISLTLISICPCLVILLWYTNVQLDGSVKKLIELFSQEGVFSTIWAIWAPVFWGTSKAWKILGAFATVQLALMKLLPGRQIREPVTPEGDVPVYRANGLSTLSCTLGLFFLGSYGFKLFSPSIIYNNFGGLLGALNLFSALFFILLRFRKRYGPSGNEMDRSVEARLYPRFFGWGIKMFTSCRFGIMGWSLIILSFACKQKELYGLSDSMIVSVLLQLIYIAKFFRWETGYLGSMDVLYDRAGFCICWGSMVWLPAIYTSPTLFLVNHPHQLGLLPCALILIAGVASILVNYQADRQRHFVRSRNGDCVIWNKKPELIFANYKTEWGEEKQSLLLASGWWGISRHFHYLPELLSAFFWSLPALFNYYLPYFYITFLGLLLIDRAYRQEKRCAMKYGKDWEKYCERVPFRLVPFIY